MTRTAKRRTVYGDRIFDGPLTKAEYLAVLKRLRARIAKDIPLSLVDSNTIGDKYTEANWGVCADDIEIYPTEDLHIFPDDFNKRQRMSPLEVNRSAGQHCPFDRNPQDASGCFYSCMLFRPKRKDPPMTRDAALALFDAKIAQFDNRGAQPGGGDHG